MGSVGVHQFLDLASKVSLQAGLFAAVVWLIARCAKSTSARLRYGLWVLVLVKFFVPPIVDIPSEMAFWQNRHQPTPVKSAVTEQALQSAHTSSSADAVLAPTAPDIASEQQSTTDWRNASRNPAPVDAGALLTISWALGASIMLTLLLLRFRRQGKFLAGCGYADEQVRGLLARAADSLGLRRVPALRISKVPCVPTLAGLWHPTIVLPPLAPGSCSPTETEAMLLHELAHIKRRDMAVVWLYELARALFFFHPAVWLAGRGLATERELACDELVLASQSIAREDYAAGYIRALRMAASSARTPVSVAMAEPFEIEKRRLQMILQHDLPRATAGWLVVIAIIAIAGLPTFAGVAIDDSMTTDQYLENVMRARGEAEMLIKSGKGDMAIVIGRDIGGRHRYLHTDANERVVFLDDRFSRLVKNSEGESRRAMAYDGRTLSDVTPQWREPITWDVSAGHGKHALGQVLELFDVVGQTYPDIPRTSTSTRPFEARTVGREKVDGRECVIVERYAYPRKDDDSRVNTLRLWIDPARGYVVPRWELWVEGGSYKTKIMLVQVQAKFRKYGDIWGPKTYTRKDMNVDSKTGQVYTNFHLTVIYASNFALNVPVTEEELKLAPIQSKNGRKPMLPGLIEPAAKPASPKPAKTPKPVDTPKPAETPKSTAPPSDVRAERKAGHLSLPCEGRLTSTFGYRTHPVTGQMKLHTGIDIAASPGTAIKAVADGMVIKSGWLGAYGNVVIVDHGDGVSTLYAHCSKVLANEGNHVRQGQIIATVGATGYATGPQCHFEKRVDGVPVDPRQDQ